MTERVKANRGPAAGPLNRASLIDAARTVFGEQGVDAPLSSVAKSAGVGQGSLYRHFPDRASLVFAVFDKNMEIIEEFAAREDSTLREVTDLITHHTEGVSRMIAIAEGDPRLGALESRLRTALAPKWAAAQQDGSAGSSASLDDLILAIAMVSALVSHSPSESRHFTVGAAWELLRRGLGA